MKKVRVRFAPSPTGPLHIGGVRTALFNYLFAKKNGGDFILRIEDTDQKRYVKGAEEYILQAFEWCGLSFDESVVKGGDYGPYRQSERKEIYQKYIKELLDKGKAYYAFDTPEELEAMRTRLQEAKSDIQLYNASTRSKMRNSLNMPSGEAERLISSGEPYVIRFKMPENEELTVTDKIRGNVTVNTRLLDDKVLFKSDGMPTYHFANIVDDRLMEISHVIRGEEWLPSMPLHVLLYRSFGWEAPVFAHLPLILKPKGNGKLSKRDGDKMGFPVFPAQWKTAEGETFSGYREDGYFPEAFINMLAVLGWNPGTEQELFSMNELIDAFSLEKIGKSGSKFDPEKTKWFNHQYLIKKPNKELAELFMKDLKKRKVDVCTEYVEEVVGQIKERANFITDLWDLSSYFFIAPETYDAKMTKKRWKNGATEKIKGLLPVIESIEHFTAQNLETAIKAYITENEFGMGQIMNALRLVIVGEGKGASLFDIIRIIGKEEAVKRIKKGIEKLPTV